MAVEHERWAGTDARNQFLGLWYFAHAFDPGSLRVLDAWCSGRLTSMKYILSEVRHTESKTRP